MLQLSVSSTESAGRRGPAHPVRSRAPFSTSPVPTALESLARERAVPLLESEGRDAAGGWGGGRGGGEGVGTGWLSAVGGGGHILKAGGRESVVHGGGDRGGRWQMGSGVVRAGRERPYGLSTG